MFRLRIILAACLLALGLGGSASFGHEWARKMFKVTSHDFGTVARGAKAEFAFELTNTYKEDVHIASVRSSCGCTTPQITQDLLKTHETASILATFNTRSFLGNRSATLTVVFDKPFYAEVQLNVTGFIRGDVVFEPGLINLGTLDQGAVQEQKVDVKYAGRNDWKIVDVRSTSTYYEVELAEKSRGNGRVEYQLLVRLKENAPAGYLTDQLMLITNDANSTNIPLLVEAKLNPSITVSPASLSLGEVAPGQKVTRMVLLVGKKDFKVTGFKCPDGCFAADLPAEAKKIQKVAITFTADDKPGKVAQKIELETDLGGAKATVTATAQVTESANP